jgi:hypothetical protein
VFSDGISAMASDDDSSLLFAATQSRVFQYNASANQWSLLPKQLNDWNYIDWLGILDQQLVAFGGVDRTLKHVSNRYIPYTPALVCLSHSSLDKVL